MAARDRIWTPEKVRQRIRASMLIRRLANHVVAPEKHPLKPTQLDAAKFLLSRVVPAAEAPKNLHIEGNLTLTQLIEQALTKSTHEQPRVN